MSKLKQMYQAMVAYKSPNEILLQHEKDCIENSQTQLA